MQNDIHHDIQNLENEILQIEDSVIEFLKSNNELQRKKALHALKSDLRHLSIIANGAPIDKNENRKIMDFLRDHYNQLQKLSVPA